MSQIKDTVYITGYTDGLRKAQEIVEKFAAEIVQKSYKFRDKKEFDKFQILDEQAIVVYEIANKLNAELKMK